MTSDLSPWRPPEGPCRVTLAGIEIPPGAVLTASREYGIVVFALCGSEAGDMRVAPRGTMTAGELARRAQIAVTIQHVVRRACVRCRECLREKIAPGERTALYSEDPKLGPILGIGGAEGLIT